MLKFKKIKGNLIHPTAIINWDELIIGKGNIIGPYVVIGNKAQWKNKKNSGKIKIGNKNIFNEYVNIHLPTTLKKLTFIGNNNFIMNSSTIDHDCYIEDNVTLSSGVSSWRKCSSNEIFKFRYKNNSSSESGNWILYNDWYGNNYNQKKIIKPGYIYYGKPAKLIKKNNFIIKKLKIDKNNLIKETQRFKKIKKEI